MPFRPKTGDRLKKQAKAVGITEPKRISTYDIIVDNFKKIARSTYIHRIVYIAQHSIPDMDDLAIKYEENIEYLNKIIFDEPLSGFLLVYSKYIAATFEGSEYGLNLHIAEFLNGKLGPLHNAKVLNFFPNINKRFSEGFEFYVTTPTSLVDKIDPNSDMKTSFNLSQQCSRKLHELVKMYLKRNHESVIFHETDVRSEMSLENTDEGSEASEIRSMGASKQSISFSAVSIDPTFLVFREFLPESDLLEFLVDNRYLMPLKKFYQMSSGPIDEAQVFDDIHPHRHPIVVPDIFEQPYNPVCELPIPEKYNIATPSTTTQSVANITNAGSFKVNN